MPENSSFELSDLWGSLRIWEPFQHGRVTLLFSDHCSEEVFARSVDRFARLMRAYVSGETYDGIDLDHEEDCWGTVLVAYNEAHDRLEVLNPLLRAGASQSVVAHQRRLEGQRRSRSRGQPKRRVEPTVRDPRSE